ncbi:MAG TPA: glycosyltransferase [Chitinophagaceae bacterium]|nr:glycosyltransferase [Chitinophagaceae bacterium]
MSRPVKIAEADISVKDLVIHNEGRYGSAYVLLRSGKEVMRMVRIPFSNGLIDREQLIKAGRHQISYKLVLEDLKHYTAIPCRKDSVDIPISVVVCTRNRTDLLRHCLEALKKLDHPQFEILIVDNAPDNDDTKKLTEEFGVRYVREDKPGLDRARNRGIRESSHQIIAFTDDDARPDRNWLRAIAANFNDEQVVAVTGFVAPAELETHAQQLFEWSYGGMGHGFSKKTFDGKTMSSRWKLAASGFGVGANMAFRKNWFDKAGYFDTALDVGTPSSGGGDIEMFHRVVANNGVLVYDPNVLVWHLHRPGMGALKKQVFNNGRSFVCYLFTCYRNKTARAGTLLAFFLRDWLLNWHIKNIFFGGGRVSRRLLLTELNGMLTGAGAYFKSRRSAQRLDQE